MAYPKIKLMIDEWTKDGQLYVPPVVTDLSPEFPLNPVQHEVLKYINEDCNLIVATKTGSGKTVCGNIFSYRYLKNGGKMIYSAPYKTLTDEKFETWSAKGSRFRRFKSAIINSDFRWTEEQREKVAEARIICATQESLLAALTNFKSDKNQWPLDADVIWVDEGHLITQEGRGANLETMLMSLSKSVTDCRILLTTGTLPNPEDFQQWLTSLNGKPTYVVDVDYQPVPISRHYVTYHAKQRDETIDPRCFAIYEQIREKHDEQFLVVVYVKAFGYKLQEFLNDRGIRCEFHNADIVSRKERKRIENSFRKKLIRVLICTTTLTVGVNIPARNVISTQSNWGNNDIPAYEILQAIGRAGRMGYDDKGFQYVYVDAANYDYHVQRIEEGEPITSTLLDVDTLLTHMNRAVYMKEVWDEDSLLKWYKRTLAYTQLENQSYFRAFVRRVFKQLTQLKMVNIEMDEDTDEITKIISTKRGAICAQMLLDPLHFFQLAMNLKKYASLTNPSDLSLAQAIGEVKAYSEEFPSHYNQKHYDPMVVANVFDSYQRAVQATLDRIRRKPSSYLTGSISYQIGRDSERWCGAMMRAVSETNMLKGAMEEEDVFVAFSQVKNGTSENQARLEYARFTKSEAKKLTALGIFSLSEAKRNPDLVATCMSTKRMIELRIGGRR